MSDPIDTISTDILPYVNAGPFAASCIVPFALATLLVALRLYFRRFTDQGIAIDDWATVISLLFCWGASASLLHGIRTGTIGSLTSPLVLNPDPTAWKVAYAPVHLSFLAFDILAIGSIKLSALLFYRRVFLIGSKTTLSWILHLTIISTLLWTLGLLLPLLITVLTPSLANSSSNYSPIFLFVFAVTDLLADLIVLCLPFPAIWGLQMPAVKKVHVTLVFLLGSVSLLASVFRLAIHTRLLMAYVQGSRTLGYDDSGLYWSMVEIGVAAVAINGPPLSPLMKKGAVRSVLRSVIGSGRRSEDEREREKEKEGRIGTGMVVFQVPMHDG